MTPPDNALAKIQRTSTPENEKKSHMNFFRLNEVWRWLNRISMQLLRRCKICRRSRTPEYYHYVQTDRDEEKPIYDADDGSFKVLSGAVREGTLLSSNQRSIACSYRARTTGTVRPCRPRLPLPLPPRSPGYVGASPLLRRPWMGDHARICICSI